MKIKRLSAIILSLIMVLGSVSAFAAVPELSEEYYSEVISYDFQEQTDAVSELPKTGDSNGMAKGYFKEEDGNIAWYGYRAQNGSGGWTNAGFSIPSSAAMASGTGDDRSGEYVIQSRFLFIQQSDKIGNLTLQTQLDDTDNKFSQDYAGVTQMGLQFSNLSVKDSFENTPVFYFKSIVQNSEGNGVWAPAYNVTLPTVQFNGNTWYTFRQTYNLDLKTYRIEIYNAAGNKVYDESVELPTKENGSIAYDAPYSGKFYGSDLLFYMTTHNMAGNGYMIDDVSIVKTLKKNVTVNYGSAYGTVESDGKTIENGGKIAVPYNSKTPVTLTVKPSSGYEVKDVKVGGVSKGKLSEISLSEIKSDQTVEIEFKKEAQKEPAAPVVSDVKISGIAMISRELTASFGYSDKNDDPMTEAVYSWEVSADGKTGWSAVGENKNTFTLTENEVGKFVRVGVVAKNDAAELNTSGDPVYSSAFGPISAMKTAPWIKENSAKIAGSGNVGGGLTAEYTYEYDSASGDVEGKTEFVWEISDSENGDYTPIDGANAKIYCPTAEQTGKYIRVRITPVDINEVKGAEAVTAGIQVTDTAIEYFVATDGDDKNPGTMDKPFATLAKAKNTVRALISKGLTSKIIVNLRGGDYRMNAGLNFDNSDSGTEEFPIVYQAYNGETVNLYGSKALDASKITKVTDDAVLDKLIEKSARDHLYQVKMSDLGISAPALNYNGASGKNVFYFNGTELINARWPNADKSGDHFFVGAEGAELTADEQGKYNGDNQPAKMKYKDETGRSKLWQFKPGDMYAGGAFAYLWARQAVKLESLDTENNILKTAEILNRGQSTYTAADDRYLYFENIFEEIDVPGESYLDRDAGILYFYPVGDVEGATLSLSTLTSTMLYNEGSKNIVFDGINIRESAADAMLLGGSSSNITVKNATISGIGGYGIRIWAPNTKIENNHLYNIANTAIKLNGGDRTTLSSSGSVVKNNLIHSCSAWADTAIETEGVGHVISHNKIYEYDMGGVRLSNVNNVVVEYNEFYDCQQLNADGGVVYFGRNVSDLGNIIRNNYFHHIGNKIGAHGQQAIFTDDGNVGPAIYGNVFYKAGQPSFPLKTHAGQFHWIHDNILIDNETGSFMQMWPSGWTQAQDKREGVGRWFFYIQDKGDLLECGNSGQWSGRKDLVLSDTWYEYYTKTEPTGQWKSMLENYINKDVNAKLEEAYAKYNSDTPKNQMPELVSLVNSLPNEYTNRLYNNVYIGIKDLVTGGNYSNENNAEFTLEEGKSLFNKFGSDFTLTEAGLAKIRESISDFSAPDFSKIGPEPTAHDEADPEASNLKVTGVPKVGNSLAASYKFADENGHREGLSKITWYVSSKPDSGFERVTRGYGPSFTLSENEEGKYVRFEIIPVDEECRYGRYAYTSDAVLVSKSGGTDKENLWNIISAADSLLSGAVAGDKPGQYPASAIEALEKEVAAAKEVANDKSAYQYQADAAADALEAAIDVFRAQAVPEETETADKTRLNDTITSAESFLASVAEGNGYGEYSSSALAGLKAEITAAKAAASKEDATQAEIDSETLKLRNVLNSTKADFNQSGSVTKDGSVKLNYTGEKAELNVSGGVTTVDIITESGAKMPVFTMNSDGAALEIPSGTAANGDFRLPLSGGSASQKPSGGSVSKVYGAGGKAAKLDKLARIVLKGEGGKRVAYISEDGKLTIVSKTLKTDSESAAESALSGTRNEAAQITVGDDLVVYTYVLGEFITYEVNSSDETPDTPGGGNGNGGGTTTKPSAGSGTNGFYSGETTNPSISNPFTDMVNHWAAADVLAMNKAGIVSGVSDTLFDPDRNITRAEFAAIIARALKLNDKTADYKDVNGEWFAPYVGACSEAGIISGYDGYFRPNDNITRQEMAVIIVNAYSYLEKQGANGGIDKFTDKAKIADWAKAAVDTASSVGLISGMGDGTFAPNANATRAQAASIVRRLLG